MPGWSMSPGSPSHDRVARIMLAVVVMRWW
jgi:hypothetical protein